MDLETSPCAYAEGLVAVGLVVVMMMNYYCSHSLSTHILSVIFHFSVHLASIRPDSGIGGTHRNYNHYLNHTLRLHSDHIVECFAMNRIRTESAVIGTDGVDWHCTLTETVSHHLFETEI